MSETSEFLSLTDADVIALSGPRQTYLALIESAFNTLIETPGGGFLITGDTRGTRQSVAVLNGLKDRIQQGLEVTQADIRQAIGHSHEKRNPESPHSVIVMGRKGAIAPKTPGQAAYFETLKSHDLVFALGPAGSGKTFMAVAHGAALLQNGEVDRLVITRPVVEAGEKLGFLPGDLNEKIDPYMAPIWQALDSVLGAAELKRRRERNEIEVAPLAYMRGRTLNNAYIIVDEAQNTTRLQMKMVLTRLGEGSRMVVTGDPSQVDLADRVQSGLAHAVELLSDLDGIGVAKLTVSDIVRHELVAKIVRAYDQSS